MTSKPVPPRRPDETVREYERRLRAAGFSRSVARTEASRPQRRGLLWWIRGFETK